jgi:hypothetical protein
MQESDAAWLPVVDGNGQFIGIVDRVG